MIEGLSRWAREVEEEEELDVAGGGEETAAGGIAEEMTGGIAEGTTGGAAPVEGGQPDSVRSKAEEVDRSPQCKECSGETVGALVCATDAGTWGCTLGGGGAP